MWIHFVKGHSGFRGGRSFPRSFPIFSVFYAVCSRMVRVFHKVSFRPGTDETAVLPQVNTSQQRSTALFCFHSIFRKPAGGTEIATIPGSRWQFCRCSPNTSKVVAAAGVSSFSSSSPVWVALTTICFRHGICRTWQPER